LTRKTRWTWSAARFYSFSTMARSLKIFWVKMLSPLACCWSSVGHSSTRFANPNRGLKIVMAGNCRHMKKAIVLRPGRSVGLTDHFKCIRLLEFCELIDVLQDLRWKMLAVFAIACQSVVSCCLYDLDADRSSSMHSKSRSPIAASFSTRKLPRVPPGRYTF
jgi:hypothetical protein